MKIAIVHEFLTKVGGAEKVLSCLHEIFPEAPIYTLLYDEKSVENLFQDKPNIVPSYLNKYPQFLIKKPKLFLPKLAKAVESFDLSEFDIVISSSNSFAHGVITKPQTFHLTYCHSPMRYAWDWYHEYLAENKIGYGLKGLYVRNVLHQVRIWDKVASNRTDKWIANSANVSDRIKKYYGFESDTIYPPVETQKIKTNENVPDDYYVIVSRIEPYKSIRLAIETFNKIKKTLVIIGTGSELDDLKKIAEPNIEFLGWQSDKSRNEYIRNAKALIFPCEDDFGIVPIEAMACGRPVIAYKKGGALETVVENKTGVFFEKQTVDDLSAAILKFEKNYLNFSPIVCRKQAEKFSKENFISKFQETLETEYEKYQKKYNEKI